MAGVKDLRNKALDLLARREHGRAELRAKLTARGFPEGQVDEVLAGLADGGLQSDGRFLEGFVAGRVARGQGPLKIAAELRARGLAGESVAAALAVHADRWVDLAREVRCRRFGPIPSAEPRERAAQMRFLAQRGFTGEQVRAALAKGRDE